MRLLVQKPRVSPLVKSPKSPNPSRGRSQLSGWHPQLNSPQAQPFMQRVTTEERGMNLKSPRFAGNPRLEAAYDDDPVMRKGERGEAVALVQQTLLDDGFEMPISTAKTGMPDGIFGNETYQTVWKFQAKYHLGRDGIVGRETLGKMDEMLSGHEPGPDKPGTTEPQPQPTQPQPPQPKPHQCLGIKKFGKEFAGTIVAKTAKGVTPFAGDRVGKPSDIMFHTGGRQDNDVLTIAANASLSPFKLGDGVKFQHGVIQTAEKFRFEAHYSGGKKALRESNDSRDCEPGATAPWVRNPPASGSPSPFLPGSQSGKQVTLSDHPRHHFPKVHPKDASATIQKITVTAVFNFWHIAKETQAKGTQQSNLAFLSNLQISLNAEAVKSTANNTFVGNTPHYTVSKPPACGKGPKNPVLNKPITIKELSKLRVS